MNLYGMLTGLVLIACGILSKWFPWQYTFAAGLLIIALVTFLGSRSTQKETTRYPGQAPESEEAPQTEPTESLPFVTRMWQSWLWRLSVLAVIVVMLIFGRSIILTITNLWSPQVQHFATSIDPLAYDTAKSKVREDSVDGFLTIWVHPGGEAVYDLEVPANAYAPEKRINIDLKLQPMKGYIGFRINQRVYKQIFLAEGGEIRLGLKMREMRPGKNELAFFAEEGPLRMDGDKRITIYER